MSELGECILAEKVDSRGYGKARHNGQAVLAHRLSYCQSRGIPLEAIKGWLIRHKCDNPPCINPDHLEIGTPADNSRDAVERGRTHKWRGTRSGEGNPKRRLSRADVDAIRARYKRYTSEHGTKALAREYNVSHRTIVDVVLGRTWK